MVPGRNMEPDMCHVMGNHMNLVETFRSILDILSFKHFVLITLSDTIGNILRPVNHLQCIKVFTNEIPVLFDQRLKTVKLFEEKSILFLGDSIMRNIY